MHSRHEPALIVLFSALVACTEPPVDEGATTTTTGETDDEVGTGDSESTTETTGDTSTETETETEGETETETETGEPDPICGNGIVEGPELCDDANAVDDDGCSNACDPRTCPFTWTRVSDQATITSSYLDNAPLAELPDGNIVIGNTVDGESSIDVRVQVWTPEGDLVWEVVHELGGLRDGLGDVLADASGDIFVGATANVGTDGIARVLRLSGTDGSILWTFESDVVGALDRPVALTFDDQNRVLVALQAGGKSGETDVEVRALDPMTGISEWKGHWTSEGIANDRPNAIGFDATTGQIWVLATSPGPADTSTTRLLSFTPPSVAPLLVTTPIEDGIPDLDEGGSLVFDAEGRMWISVKHPSRDESYFQIAEIDEADGSVVKLIDSRDMAIEGKGHATWTQGELDGLSEGGLVLAGWTLTYGDPRLEHYGYVLTLDAEGQHDCVVRFTDYEDGNYPFQPLSTSSGAIFVNGHIRQSGDWHSLLMRVR